MTEPTSQRAVRNNADEISLLGVATLMLRGRRTILALMPAGGTIGLAYALLRPRVYTSSATFIPEESDPGTSGFARAASQLGITLPNTGNGWGPSVYVELLRSRALLEPLALDTLPVAEQGGRRISMLDLFGVDAPTAARRTDLAVRVLGSHIKAAEEKNLKGVKVTVSTRWPSVSYMLADRLVRGVGRFNVERRKSQAAAERQFVDGLASDAERALRVAEDGLQSFLQRNRAVGGSPQLVFERDRMQREVALRQQIYTSLLQNREEARIREVRDTPVITILEEPRLPVVPEPRKTVLKVFLGALGGALLGMLVTFLGQGLAGARMAPNKEEREFFELLAAATPRFRKRGAKSMKKEHPWSPVREQK
jgi:putative tyrosine kinase-like protein/subunit length determinant Wzz-like protein